MLQGLLRWCVLALAVWTAAAVVPGIEYDGVSSLLLASAVLALLNVLVKPILQFLMLPFILLTFGLFLLIVNAAVLALTAFLVPGFRISGFWPAVGASLIVSLVSMLLGSGTGRQRPVSSGRHRRWARSAGPPPGVGRVIDV